LSDKNMFKALDLERIPVVQVIPPARNALHRARRRSFSMKRAHFPGRAPIDSYGRGGFRFAGMSHRGSIMALPDGISEWDAVQGGALGVADFRILEQTASLPQILLVGTGRSITFLDAGLRDYLRALRLNVDTMDTGAAVRTYNILLEEGRSVGAALVAVE